MKRRRFVGFLAAAIAGPTVLAQQGGRVYRVGMLIPVSEMNIPPYRAALAESLAKHGFVEGRNLQILARAAMDSFHEDRQAVRALLEAKVDALFTCFTGVTRTAITTAKNTPIVFAWVTNPVESGIVKSFARPGGNVTGATNRVGELIAKRLELAHELVPGAKRIGLVGGFPLGLDPEIFLRDVRKAAASLGVELLRVGIGFDTEGAVLNAVERGAQALLFITQYLYAPTSVEVGIRAAREKRIPAIFADAAAVEAGALIALGTNVLEDIRRGGDLLGKVLRGAKPATLPVDQAARFEMVVNLKTAREIGITVPRSILVRADRVIE